MPTRLTRARGATLIAGAVIVAMLAVAAVALAKTFTLNVAKNATVTNAQTMATTHENIGVNGRGFAVYWLSGDSKSHPKCTQANECFRFWPPVTAASAKALSKASGISGKLTSWTRDGFTQAVLGGHPIYTFAPDTKKHDATGDHVVSFGGTWHVVTASAGSTSAQKGQQTNTNANPNPYPMGY
jgi:predicted lipoprotein with Yx(FWY)xxD motif